MMKKMKRWVAGWMSAWAFLGGMTVSAQESFKVGGNFELSGDAAAYGTMMKEGMELAIDQANDQGGVLGQTVEVIMQDNKSDTTESASVVSQLVDQGVVGVVGPATTANAQASFPTLMDQEVPVVLPAATGDGLALADDGSVMDYVFRVCFADSYQGAIAAEYAVKELSAQRAVILSDSDTDYSQGLAAAFRDHFESLDGEIVAEEYYLSGDSDFMSAITNLSAQDYDIIYAPGYYTELGLFIQQAREMGIEAPIIGSDGMADEKLVELAGAHNATDIYYTSHFSTESQDPEVQAFLEAFEEKFNKPAGTFAALSYDAMNLIFDAMERADSTDPVEIAQAIAETEDFKGITGTVSIDENHDPVKSAVVIEVQEGDIVQAQEMSID